LKNAYFHENGIKTNDCVRVHAIHTCKTVNSLFLEAAELNILR